MLNINKDDEDILKNLIIDKQKARLEHEYSEHKMEVALEEDFDNEQVEKQVKTKLERARGLQEELDKIIDWIPTEKEDEVKETYRRQERRVCQARTLRGL